MKRREAPASSDTKAPAKPRKKPMAEGIRKTQMPRGFFKKMSDDELVAHAKEFMGENGISEKTEIRAIYKGLYEALRIRKLLDKVGFKEKQRDWASMSNDEVVAYAKEFMKEKGITGRRELWKADEGFYYVLLRRKLLDRVGFEEKQRSWKEMSDEELVAFAKKSMKEKGIKEKAELRKAETALYYVLLRRKLLDRLGFVNKGAKKPVKTGRAEKEEDNARTEIEGIALRREELIREGMDDKDIAKQIAKEMKKRPETIGFFIYRILNNNRGVKNSNNHKTSDDK